MILKSKHLNILSSCLFHLILIGLIVHAYEPAVLRPLPMQIQDLLSGTRNSYITPGSQLSPIKNILPQNGAITLLTDHPYRDVTEEAELAHDFQNYVCPLVLNPYPEENTGIIFATSAEAADARLSEAGYAMVGSWDTGKGIIVKKP